MKGVKLKTCSSCKKNLEESEFYSNKRRKDGLCQDCKTCHYARNRKYYTENSEKTAEYRRKYYLEHQITEKNHMKAYREERKDLRRIRLPRDQHRPDRASVEYKKVRNSHLKKFNITQDDYLEMLERQNCVCAICLQPSSNGYCLAVDHDHQTGRIRKLLCHRCNTSLGLLQENIGILQKMIAYLKEHQEVK